MKNSLRMDHVCPRCGAVRSITGHRYHHDKADQRLCIRCAQSARTPSPDTARYSLARAGTLAAAKGFTPDPESDWVVVDRLTNGIPVQAIPAEMAAAVAQLTAAGTPAADIASRLRVSKRTVERWRSRIRLGTA